MENPLDEIHEVLKALCQGSPDEQQRALETYFLPEAAFTHPFCRVPPFKSLALPRFVPGRGRALCSREVIAAIYRWYRFMSPHIEFHVDAKAHDKRNHILYLTIQQKFAIWFIPFYSANVRLVTELHLSQERPPPAGAAAPQVADGSRPQQRAAARGASRDRYYIASQEDHYQVNEFLRFVLPVVGPLAWTAWQLISSLLCLLLALPIFILDRTLRGKGALISG